MTSTIKPIRIEAPFESRDDVRAMIERHAPYPSIAVYAPEGLPEPAEADRSVLPMFRGNWVVGGKPLVDGAEIILHNKKFLEAAQALFGTTSVYPQTVLININAPMPAGAPHVDVPTFRGATRQQYPLPLLKAMGASGLFERWRVVQAGALSWFYDGIGGEFDYWPEGIDGPMRSERPPFGNVSLVIDSDRMYHRIGRVGDPEVELPRISAAAEICPRGSGAWAIVEDGEIRGTYSCDKIRLSILWKAELRDAKMESDRLTLDRILEIFVADLCRRRIAFRLPADPAADTEFILLLQRCYVTAHNGVPAGQAHGPR